MPPKKKLRHDCRSDTQNRPNATNQARLQETPQQTLARQVADAAQHARARSLESPTLRSTRQSADAAQHARARSLDVDVEVDDSDDIKLII